MKVLSAVAARYRTLGRTAAVLLVCGFSFFVHLGAPEVGLMESRNFVAAREMAGGGSWLIPTMNLELRLAKPPLPTWAVATVMRLTGNTESVALLRLPAALLATLLVLFFWGLARELTRDQPAEADQPGRTAWLGALVLASSLLIVTNGRDGQWDIFTNSFLIGSLWLLVRGWRASDGGYGWFAGAGLLAGCSILSKGPVSLYAVLLPFLAVFATGLNPLRALHGGWRGHRTGLLLAGGIALVVGGAWPAYIMYHVKPAALAVARTEVTAWGERHVQSVWYYSNFFVFSGVWVVAALAALAVPYARRRLAAFVPYGLGLGWLLVALVLLSLVPEKKERYMLPLLPPLALLIAGMLRYWEQAFRAGAPTREDTWILRFWSGVLAVVSALVPAAMVVAGEKLPGFGPASLRFGAVVVLGGGLLWVALGVGWRQRRPLALVGASFALMAALLTVFMPAYPLWEARKGDVGLRRLPAARQAAQIKRLPWYSLEEMHVKQVWAAGRAVPVWDPEKNERPFRQLPVVLFSARKIKETEHIPQQWEDDVEIETVDSFYLERERKEGQWYISVMRPAKS